MKKAAALTLLFLIWAPGAYAQESAATYDSGVAFYEGPPPSEATIIVVGRRPDRNYSSSESESRPVISTYENDGGERRYVYTRRWLDFGSGSFGTRLSATDSRITPRGIPSDDGNRGAFRGDLVIPTPLRPFYWEQ